MNIATLATVMKARGLSQTDVGRLAGVSRQAVSLWFHAAEPENVNIHGRNLKALSRALGIDMDELAEPIPGLDKKDVRSSLEAGVLWDKLFPDLEHFAIASFRGDPKALARLVQSQGLYAAERMAGKQVWTKFNTYKKYILPVRRRELERLWNLESRLAKS